MKLKKLLSIVILAVFVLTLAGCAAPDKNYGVKKPASSSSSLPSESEITSPTESVPEITSLDSMMSKFFDITLFDEENYSDIYLGNTYKLNAKYCNTSFKLPSKLTDLNKNGWELVDGSDYDDNSLIYAKETAELVFSDKFSNKITALFYNSKNTSVRLADCEIVKLRIKNGYINNPEVYSAFDINGIKNTSVITDVIQTFGTPSHFYKKSENAYYFDYFYEKSDRRNKIRIYINLTDDSITEVEFSNYK